MNKIYLVSAIFTMALITYLIRMIPLTFFRKKITNPYIKAFLNFVPFSVLGAMTIPDALFATGSVWSAIVGIICALILAFKEKGLLTVSLISCLAVFVTDFIIKMI